jgi:hypothetical protein
MSVTPPTDDELNTLIRARLAGIGIDLSQLHPSDRNPETGSPSQASVLSSLRSFLRNTVPQISGWTPPADGPDAMKLQQQLAPPDTYPSITAGRTEGQ